MKKVFSKETFIKICISFLLIYLIIVIKNCFNEKMLGIFIKSNKYFYYMFYLFLSILTFLLFIGVKKLIDKLNPKKLILFNVISFLLIIVGQLILFVSFDVEQVTDAFGVNERAISIVNGDSDLNLYYDYFEMYENNNMDLYTTINVLRIAKLFHVTNYTRFLVFFNIIMIDIFILFLYLTAKKIKDKKFGSFTLGLCLLNPLSYLTIFWTYTVSYSLPFFAIIIYLYLLIKDNKFNSTKIKNIVYCLLFGIIGAYGYLMRPTLIIPFVAMLLIFIYDLIIKRIKIKEVFVTLIVIVISFGLSYKTFFSVSKKYVGEQKNTFPISHWIMMGLHGKGTVTVTDNDFTASFKTKEEKKKANKDEIIRTLKEYKIKGLIKHFLVKIPVTWSDGTSGYNVRMLQDKKLNKMYLYLAGDKKDLIALYAKTFRFVLYILIFIYLLKELLKKEYEKIDLFALILLGAFLFYAIWEAKNAYAIPFTMVFIILGAHGFELTYDKIKTISKKKINISLVFIILFSFISLGFGYKYLVHDKKKIKEYSTLVANNVGHKSIKNVYEDDKEIVQTFKSKNKFNVITIMAKTISKSDVEYVISIMKDEEELYSKSIDYTSINTKNDFITIKLPKNIKTYANEEYKIVIKKNKEKKVKEKKDSIGWIYIRSYASDNYDGTLYVGENKTDDDLYTRIFYYHKTNYLNKYIYIVLSLIIIGSETLIIIIYNKNNKVIVDNIKEITKKSSNGNKKSKKKNNKKKRKK